MTNICNEINDNGECLDDYEYELNELQKEALLDIDFPQELAAELDSVSGSRVLDLHIAGIDIGDD